MIISNLKEGIVFNLDERIFEKEISPSLGTAYKLQNWYYIMMSMTRVYEIR